MLLHTSELRILINETMQRFLRNGGASPKSPWPGKLFSSSSLRIVKANHIHVSLCFQYTLGNSENSKLLLILKPPN